MCKLDKNVKRKRSVILRISLFWGHAEGFLFSNKPCGVEVSNSGTIKKHLNLFFCYYEMEMN